MASRILVPGVLSSVLGAPFSTIPYDQAVMAVLKDPATNDGNVDDFMVEVFEEKASGERAMNWLLKPLTAVGNMEALRNLLDQDQALRDAPQRDHRLVWIISRGSYDAEGFHNAGDPLFTGEFDYRTPLLTKDQKIGLGVAAAVAAVAGVVGVVLVKKKVL